MTSKLEKLNELQNLRIPVRSNPNSNQPAFEHRTQTPTFKFWIEAEHIRNSNLKMFDELSLDSLFAAKLYREKNLIGNLLDFLSSELYL